MWSGKMTREKFINLRCCMRKESVDEKDESPFLVHWELGKKPDGGSFPWHYEETILKLTALGWSRWKSIRTRDA